MSSNMTAKSPPNRVGRMYIRRLTRTISRSTGSPRRLDTNSKALAIPCIVRSMASRDGDFFQEMIGYIAAIERIGSGAQTLADDAGQHRLHVFRNHVCATGDQCPCTGGMQESERRSRTKAVG